MNSTKNYKSISCDEALEIMFEYIDGMLSKETGAKLEQHIETCRGCLKKLDFQLKLKKRMQKVKTTPASKKLLKQLNLLLN
jgi:anti-sigma factor (TIGR02949 family)